MDNYVKYLKYKLKYYNLKNNIMYGGNPHGDAMRKIFPAKEGVEYNNLQIHEEGYYSATPPGDSLQIFKFMEKYMGRLDDKIITDLTGNVGGDTIAFALKFKYVHSIEINHETFEILENNVNVFKLGNVRLYEGDSTSIYDWPTDVLYIDAPWGGKDYILKKKLDLLLGDIKIDNFLNTILQKENRPKWIFLKVPRNYNFSAIDKLNERFRFVKYSKENIMRFKKRFNDNVVSYNIICIQVY